MIPDKDAAFSYKPIYLIFVYITLVTLLIALVTNNWHNFMPNFMAGFFLIFSFFKILDLKGFANGYSNYDLIAKKIPAYAYIYPFLEIFFGLAYIVVGNNIALNIFVFIVMLVSTFGVIKSKLLKQQFTCACVGTFLKVPLGNIAIIENLLMIVMSFLMIFYKYH